MACLNNCGACIKMYTGRLKALGVSDEELVELMAVIDLVGGMNHFTNGLRIHLRD